MSYVMGTVNVPGNSTVTAFIVPPGYNNVTIYQVTQAQGVFVGNTNKVSATNGMPVPVTPLSTEQYSGSAGLTYFATTGNATAATFSYLISSTN